MYYYKFESVDFEEQSAFELTHWKKFNPKELDEMVIKAIRTYVEEDYDTYQNFPGHLDIGDLFKIWGRYIPIKKCFTYNSSGNISIIKFKFLFV